MKCYGVKFRGERREDGRKEEKTREGEDKEECRKEGEKGGRRDRRK